MTTPESTPDIETSLDATREEERAERDTAIAEEIAQTERIAGALRGDQEQA
jgi:hypothetical protein